MITSEEKLSLNNLAGGAVVERFDQAMDDIFKNLMDPDTTDKKREIVLKVVMKRNDDRTMVSIDSSCVAKPAPRRGTMTQAFMGRDSRGRVQANEIVPPQQPLFDDNVTPIRKEGNHD